MSLILQNPRQYMLPVYALGVDLNHIQEPVNRPNGYPSYQISQCVEGSGIFVDENGTEHTIETGDVFFFSPNVAHKYFGVSESWKCSYIVFTGHCAGNIIDYLGFNKTFVLKFSESDIYSTSTMYFTKINEMYYSNIESKTERCSSILYALLIFLSETIHLHNNLEMNNIKRRIMPALSYIRTHPHLDISIDHLAEIVGVSRSRFTSMFKSTFGTTPASAIKQFKIEHAKQLMKFRPEIKIKDVSESLGFSSVSYFVTVFKHETGMSPQEYKNTITEPFLW